MMEFFLFCQKNVLEIGLAAGSGIARRRAFVTPCFCEFLCRKGRFWMKKQEKMGFLQKKSRKCFVV